MRYAILTNGVPVPTKMKTLLNRNGVKFPPAILRDPVFKAANNIVEVQEQKIDERFYTQQGTPTYTDLGNGVWQEVLPITTKPIADLQKNIIQQIEDKKKQVLRGGLIVLTKNISTESEDIDKLLLIDSFRGRKPFPAGGVVIFTMEGQRIKANETQFNTLMDALALHFYNTDNNADTHIVAVTALVLDTDVLAYDFTTGWPANPVQGN